jgi:hypothetical protein
MANSTSNLDNIRESQSGKATTANELFDALSPSSLFGRRASATSDLTWGYYGGCMLVDGSLTTISNSTIALTGSATNYVEATPAGVVTKNTAGFTAGYIPLYTIVTASGSITSYTDERAWVSPEYLAHKASISITSADVTLTAAQARCRHIMLSGTLTANRNLIVPNSGEWVIYDNTSGAFSVTVKTTSGSGVATTQGSAGIFVADGTDVFAAAGGSSGSTDSFKTISVSGQSDVVADSGTDVLNLVAGTNITITTDASTDSITIESSGGGGGSISLGTPTASTSGTSINYASIPSGTKEITINFVGVSTNGSSNILIQIGDSGGIETTGYLSSGTFLAGTIFSTTSTSGFVIQTSSAADVRHGSVTLRLVDSTNFTWVASGVLCKTDAAVTIQVSGSKSLSAELDRVRITTDGGTDTFDAGVVNIMYQ